MKAAHLIHSVDNDATGTSTAVRGLCRALDREGIAIDLLTLDWTAPQADERFIHRFSLKGWPRRLGRSMEMRAWLETQARANNDFIMHAHELWMMTGYYPYRVRRQYPGSRLMFSAHGSLSKFSMASGSRLKPIYWAAVQRRALAAADCLHATSVEECLDMRRLGFRAPIAIIPNGVLVPEHRVRSDQDSRTILYLGRLHPEKGLAALLDAWSLVEKRLAPWTLHLIGPDPIGYRTELQSHANRLGLQNVVFGGAVAGDIKLGQIERAEVLVLPSPSENFGMVVAEALAMGVPVVATSGTPWAELATRRTGWYCGTHACEIANALLNAAMTSLSERRAMGERGRIWMAECFGWENVGNHMAATYSWLAHGGTRPEWIDTFGEA